MDLRRDFLAASTGAAAAHAAIAGAGAGHDSAAGSATGRVAHVVHALHGVGGVVDHPSAGGAGDPVYATVGQGVLCMGCVLRVGGWIGRDAVAGRRAVLIGAVGAILAVAVVLAGGAVVEDVFVGDGLVGTRLALQDGLWAGIVHRGEGVERDVRRGLVQRLGFAQTGSVLAISGHADRVAGSGDGALHRHASRGGETGEEVELGPREEAHLDPAEDVIHDGLGEADLRVAGPAGGLEAGVGELLAQHAQRHAMLQRDADGGGEAVHQAGDGGALLGHADKDLSGVSVGIEADRDVAFVACDGELVRDRGPFSGQAMAAGARRGLGVGFIDVLRAGGQDLVQLAGERGVGCLQRIDALGGGEISFR